MNEPDVPTWLANLRVLVGDEHGRISKVARLAKMERQQLAAILDGKNANPGIKMLGRLAHAVGKTVDELFARPGGGTGHGTAGTVGGGGEGQGLASYLTQLAALGDEQFPAPDTWQGDVHQAIAALNRALRRQADTANTGTKT